MKIRATVRLRNDAMISARERLGLSQGRLALKSGVPIWTIMRLEKLDYPKVYPADAILTLSVALEIDADAIMPSDLAGHKLESNHQSVTEMSPSRILAASTTARYTLPSPADQAEQAEAAGNIRDLIHDKLANLSFREREVIKARFGFESPPELKDNSLMSLAKYFNISRERVRQIEARAIRRLGRTLAELKDRHEYAHVFKEAFNETGEG